MPPECPACLAHHEWGSPCVARGLVKRLRARVREQEDELRALRALVRPTYMPEDSGTPTTECDRFNCDDMGCANHADKQFCGPCGGWIDGEPCDFHG
jgi:hypothetical protein